MVVISLALMLSAATKEFGLPPGLLASVCYVESTYNVKAIHHDDGDEDSLGVCQVKLKTARWLGFKGDARALMNPQINMYYSAKVLKYQLKRYKGSVVRAAIAYNKGNANGLTQTKYSVKVLKIWEEFYGTKRVERALKASFVVE